MGTCDSEDEKCKFYKKKGHCIRDCVLLIEWLEKKGKEIISFIDESMYTDYAINTWWIDSGATVHVANSMQGLRDIINPRKGVKEIRAANGVEVDKEAIGQLPLELNNNFTLLWREI